jgi:WD40 repeat protein
MKRLNLLDVNIEERYLIIGIEKKAGLFPLNLIKCNSKEKLGKMKIILECEDLINQLKIMKAEGINVKNKYYVIAVDNKGFLHSKLIKYDHAKDTVIECEYKKFNCKIESPDNSLWSLDCFYPFIIVGGNHRCVLLNYVHEEHNDNSENIQGPVIHNSLILTGNKHNVPSVTFSPDGNYIACSSIDTEVKIWETISGKLIKKVSNKTKQWYK